MSPTTKMMHYYVLNLTYIRPLAEVEAVLDAHSHYLDSAFQRGAFLLSGRKDPWTGGIIFARAASRDDLERIIAEDPFLTAQVATYEIMAFRPTRASADLAAVVA
jgi:uncharacterized protein YciI